MARCWRYSIATRATPPRVIWGALKNEAEAEYSDDGNDDDNKVDVDNKVEDDNDNHPKQSQVEQVLVEDSNSIYKRRRKQETKTKSQGTRAHKKPKNWNRKVG